MSGDLVVRRERRRVRRERLPRFADRLALGDGGLRVSPFCLGMVGDPRTVVAAYDAGVNFFFVTADMHWPLYEGTRRGLEMLFARSPSAREDVVVAGVSYVTQPEFSLAPYLELIEGVRGLGRLDVLVAGGAYQNDGAARVALCRDHARTGRVPSPRAVGVSVHERAAAAPLVNRGSSDVTFVRYNAAHPGADVDVFPHLAEGREGLVFGFKSTSAHVDEVRCAALGLAPDDWRPRVTDHYRWSLTRAELDGLLCGLSSPAQVEALDAALGEGPLDDEEHTYLHDLARLDAGLARLAPRP